MERRYDQERLLVGVVVREKVMAVKAVLKIPNNIEFKILVLDNAPEHPQGLVLTKLSSFNICAMPPHYSLSH